MPAILGFVAWSICKWCTFPNHTLPIITFFPFSLKSATIFSRVVTNSNERGALYELIFANHQYWRVELDKHIFILLCHRLKVGIIKNHDTIFHFCFAQSKREQESEETQFHLESTQISKNEGILEMMWRVIC